jgi:hypothetical protein
MIDVIVIHRGANDPDEDILELYDADENPLGEHLIIKDIIYGPITGPVTAVVYDPIYEETIEYNVIEVRYTHV